MEAQRTDVSKGIYRKHLNYVKEINNTCVVIGLIDQVLNVHIAENENSLEECDFPYRVPSHKKGGTKAYRTKKEIAAIIKGFKNEKMYESYISILVSKFESFLFDCLEIIISAFPQKISTSCNQIKINTSIDIKEVVNIDSLSALKKKAIHNILHQVFYADPKAYIDYFSKISGIGIENDYLHKYYELKATRDLIIHNDSTVNKIYLSKAGEFARATEGKIPINFKYFEESIVILKRLSGVISREAIKIYGPLK